jgi:AcrR family transcriptional regulator
MSAQQKTVATVTEAPRGDEGATDDGGRDDGGRPKRADARLNYERLLVAAKEEFAEHGGQASMEAIAKRAGVGVGTLYRHFPKRIDLVEAVYKNDVDELVEVAEKAVADQEPWQAMNTWLVAFVRYAHGKRSFLTELHEAFEKNPDLRVASRERIDHTVDIVLQNAQRAGVVRRDIDGADLMQLLGPMCMSPTLSAEQGDRLLAMIIDGLRPPS